MDSLFILGRQSALSLAELESIYGPDKIRPIAHAAAVVAIEPHEVRFARLGGMVKFCKILTTLDTTSWKDIEKFLVDVAPGHASDLPEGKLRLGLSVYGLKTTPKEMMATGLELKKHIRKSGRSVRLVPNKELELNSAQVLHNQLTGKLGWELVFMRDGNKTIVAQSIAVQDIERYAARDQARPYRDSKVGMLPPKLAQIIINLSLGNKNPEQRPVTLLDPFCGTGVILQEALLMGCAAAGTDLDERMVEYSDKNMTWLQEQSKVSGKFVSVKQGDATSYSWSPTPDTIACETFLGRPLSSAPSTEILKKIVQDCDTIHTKFLKNVVKQTQPGFRMCIAVPAWKKRNGFAYLPVLDSLEKLGYNRIKFVHAKERDLIYHRPDQFVARELVVLERK